MPPRNENALALVDIVLHLLNFLAPACGVAALGALLAKTLMRGTFAGIGWTRVLAWAATAGLVASIAGLAIFGRDGRIETYAALVLLVALGLAAAARRGDSA
ncbi:MAG: hypothetical protein ABIO45_14940 [Burkholderiaceae bacterium]